MTATEKPPSIPEKHSTSILYKIKKNYELLTLPLPFILWYFTFILYPLGFWPTLALSTSILLAVSIPRLRKIKFQPTVRGLIIGAVLGLALFGLFYFGAKIANSIPGFPSQVSAVYSFRGNFPLAAIAVLLLFPIGPGEATYWQGFILHHLDGRVKPWAAALLTSFLYMIIHLPTLNPSLMLVAFIVGLAWSFAFNKLKKNLFPIMVSHIIFDEFAFVLFMIG
ncbi:MAG TPA: type II CAAX endopeptidase family protein [Candidatus Binatia bacterium]|nr:type II CAAX endopeptidase family protein [Candidatus Binatia bacterium]